jgi:hypothetical protein
VKYKDGDDERNAVYIPRRDTDSTLNVLLAGKIFSWPHFPAHFNVDERDGNFSVEMHSKDADTRVSVGAQLTNVFPTGSMFDSIEHASKCFQECPLGISPASGSNRFKMIRLVTTGWAVRPLQINHLKSTFFEDRSLFPVGSICFDNALLMEDIAHEWHSVSGSEQTFR